MATKIVSVQLGSNPALMPGDVVITRTKPVLSGRAVRVTEGIVTMRPTDDGNRQLMDFRRRDVRMGRTKDRLPSEVGCLVEIRNGSHTGLGTLQHVNGGYNYVRRESGDELELYPNEFRVQSVFRHPDFMPGTVVRFVDPNQIVWGKQKRTTHGIVRGVAQAHIIVQAMDSRAGNVFFMDENDLVVENSKMREPMDESELADLALAKLAIRALLVTCGTMTVGQLTGLLATQGQNEEAVRTNLFELVGDGKVNIDKDHVMISANDSADIVQEPIRDALFAATDAVRKAKTALADAVFKTIADTGARLPR